MKLAILIVDDEYGLADIMADLLAERGHDVAVAIDGKLGLESLAARPVDLILLDVMMPVMDGPTMLRAVRANSATANVPVIMMTALPEALPKDDPPLHDAALHKPFTPQRMLALIDDVLARRRG